MTTPAIQLPGSFPIPSAAPVYVDSIPVALAGQAPTAAPGSQDFWSSQPRLAGDPSVEQLTITLGQSRSMNYIALDLPRFPHIVTFWWWDGALWQPVNTPAGIPLSVITTGSVPAVVDNPAALLAGQNPFHYGAGHWVHHDEQTAPFTASKIMLCAVRAVPATYMQLPVNPAGAVVPYPLGARGIDFGYRVLSAADVPPMPRHPQILSMRQPFTTTADVNGSPVQAAMRENRAADLLAGGTWRSAPQPSASSVVSLYLDSRNEQGEAQVIDRFYLEPITSGVRFNLYYAPQPPPSGTPFQALDDPLLPALLNAAGTQLPVAAASGIVFSNQPGWLTLSNQAAGTVADEPWWAGIEIMPAFSSSDSGTYIIADAGLLQLSYSDGTWTATMPVPGEISTPNQPSGGVLGQWAFSFSPGDRLQFAVGYDGQNFFTWCPRGAMFQSPVNPPVPPAPVFRFGGLQDINPADAVLAGNYTLTSFILKQEIITVPASGWIPPELLEFALSPARFVSPPPGDAPSTMNAVARFSPQFVLGTVNPWGFVGGLGEAYEACYWVPVRRSYTLARGFVEFDPVSAAAWKFEFTHLRPEPFEWLRPVPVSAQYFPPQATLSPDQVNPVAPVTLDPGLTVGQKVAPSVTFDDTPQQSPDATPGVPLATEALYAPDPSDAARLTAMGGSLYNFQPWQPPHQVPVAAVSGPSAYQEQAVPVSSRVAYFVALSSIAMYRYDYTAIDDTEQYTDTFADTANIDTTTLVPGGWAFQPGTGLVTPSNLSAAGASVQSLIFNSAHVVTGVQFATVQSDPVQLLADSDFSDPGFTNWGPVGDAQPLVPSAVSAQLGIMAQVSRGPGANELDVAQPPESWSFLENTYGTWEALQIAIPDWDDFTQSVATSAMGGIAYTGTPVPTVAAGRLYAAARVFSPVALTAPLYLQLLDGATGAVIAEAEQAVSGGSVTEWFAGFTLGEGLVSANTWQGLQTEYVTWAGITAAGITWQQADTSQTPLGGTVTVRLIQKDSTTDTWDVDNISVFEDGLVWEFSIDGGATWYPAYDIRNNPRGVVTFPAPAPGFGTQLMWRVNAYRPGLIVSALAIRPWYITWPRGIMPRAAGVGHGPNVSPWDHYGPVEDDPRWQLSSSPVPDSWFFAIRQALNISEPGSSFPGPPQPATVTDLGNAIVWEPPAVAESEPQTYSDIYSDTYTDQYAIADGGDIYTDTYCDTYGQNNLVITGTQWQGAAPLAAAAGFTATAAVVPLPAWGLGADLGPVAASDSSVTAWINGTGLALPARRVALGNQIPASLAFSPASGDAGRRRVLFDVRPDSTTTPALLDAFLASCQAGGLQASVSIWAGADTAFGNVQDWLNLIPAYAAVVHRNGYRVVLTVDNHSVTQGWLSAWYPGDDFIDVIAPTFWCTGPAPGSGADTLGAAQAFADAHGKPFGLAGTGADHSKYTAAQEEAFITYLQRVFTGRAAARKQNYDVIWLGTGNYSVLTAQPGVLAAYKALGQAL